MGRVSSLSHAFVALEAGLGRFLSSLVLAASPKSASQISPGWGFIEQVEDLPFGGTRARDIKDVVIGELYNLSDALPGLCRSLRFPLAQSSI